MIAPNDSQPQELRASYARDLECEQPSERWLIQDLWSRAAVGVIGGAAKSFKSFLALDLALSVASNTPALDRFDVDDPGRALVYLAEDSLPQVRSRLEALCRHRGLDFQSLDLVVITEPVLQLDTQRDQTRLRATVERFAPRILLLDPLVRIHASDENSSIEISRLLGYFRDLQRTHGLAIVLVHHVTKRNHSRPGQALRGSSDLHAWGDSNAYLSRKDDRVTLTLEHRAARPASPMALRLSSSPSELDTHLELIEESAPEEKSKPTIEQRLLGFLASQDHPLPRTYIRAQLRINNQRLGQVLDTLHEEGKIRRGPAGWYHPSKGETP